METIIDILKLYFTDFIAYMFVFICGIGIGMAINELINRWLEK